MKGFTMGSVIGYAATIVAIISAIIAADGRYTKTGDLEEVKNEIISEMRREVAKNRSILIGSLQRAADDIEFQISEYVTKSATPPRFLIEKHKQLNRLVYELQQQVEEK